MFILEPNMTFTHTFDPSTESFILFNPFNGAPLMELHRITQEGVDRIMRDLNSGARHIHSEWVWYGSHGKHIPVIR